MIARHWKGLARKERAADYISHLRNETFENLKHLDGFVQASILSRDTDAGVQFLIVTEWENMEVIKQFAGDDPEVAVVPKVAQEMMVSYDSFVTHYKVLE